jgi:hypothetical protein
MPASQPLLSPVEVSSDGLSTRDCNSTQTSVLRTPDPRFLRDIDRKYGSRSRKGVSDNARHEIITTTTPKLGFGDNNISIGVTSESVCGPSIITTPGVERIAPNQNSSASKTCARKTSPVETALRDSLGKLKAVSSTTHSPKSNWASNISNSRDINAVETGHTIRSSAPSFASEYESDKFSDIGSNTSVESPHDIPARVKVREAARTTTGHVDQLADNKEKAKDPAEPDGKSSNALYPRRDTSSVWRRSSVSLLTSAILPPREITSQQASEVAAHTQAAQTLLSLAGGAAESTPSLPVTVTLQSPQNATRTAASTVLTKLPPRPVDARLSVSPITTTISQAPLATSERFGLSFSEANAIIYMCTTLAAMRCALYSLGGDIAAMDLMQDIVSAVLLGVALCTILHWRMQVVYSLRCVLENIL